MRDRLAPLVANRYARVGLVLLGLVLVAAALGPRLAPGDGSLESMLAGRNTGPSWAHLFGTTMQGNDVLSQVLQAAPLTLELVGGATLIGLVLAILVGIGAGAIGGRVDAALSTVTGVFLAIPLLPLAIVVAGALPRGQHTAAATMVMVGLGTWAAEARVLRAQAMALRTSDFAAAAFTSGERRLRIVLAELLPNMASRVAAGFFFVAIQATIALATLDYLASLSRGHFALGDTNGTTWGSLLAVAQVNEALLTGSWWSFTFPALALLATAAGLVLAMYGLEQLADPRLRTGGVGWRFRELVSVRRPHRPELGSPLPRLQAFVTAAPELGRYLIRRVPIYAIALLGCMTIAYALPRLAWHGRLQAPPPTGSFWGGYAHFLHELAMLHLGLGTPGVGTTVRSTLPYSLILVGAATLVAFAVGSALGMLASWRRGGHFDAVVTTGTAVLWTIPTFALAGVAMEFLGVQWKLFPIQWAYGLDVDPSWTWRFVASAFRHAQLPFLVLTITSVGLWVLSMRTVNVSVANDDYVHFARAKGLSERRIMLRYAGRNALLPTLTGFAVAFSLAIGGVPALEEVFSYSGGGFALQQAAMTGNLPLVQALVVAIALSVVLVNVLVDVAQVALDPRLRVEAAR
jgi:peptide/nickel transport system permease protein